MFLSKLELHGFKSFAQKTTIHFAPGVTAVVGPNGCGKTNVVDAIRWVLGEQRARLVRSERMENVLFNGAAGRRPLGLAEVSLTVENSHGVLPTHYGEVTVTRRLHRSGDAEYLLNGTPCRLKDVLDLFMDTGLGAGAYSVIELKMVEDLLSDSTADRRRLFEEAAGVTKYKLRRQQALKQLDGARADLTRVADLADELEKRVAGLQRQAQKAQRHRKLADRLLALELALTAHDAARLDEEQRTLDAEARRLRDEADGLSARLTAAEAALERERTGVLDRERALAERQAARAAHLRAVQALDAEARVGAERRAADARALDRLDAEEEADTQRSDELAREREALAERQQAAGRAVEAAAMAEAEARLGRDEVQREAEAVRIALADARREADADRKKAADARAALDRLRDRRGLRDEERARLDAEAAALAERLAALEPEADHDAARIKEAERQLARAEAALGRARQSAERLRRAWEDADRQGRDARLARDTARAERDLLEALVAAGDGAPDALAFLAESAPSPPPTVAEILGCDERDRLAFDAALGDWAHAVVVEAEAEADGWLRRLRQSGRGRATFIALDRLPARPAAERSPTPPESVPALVAVRAPARYDRLLRLLLANWFIVEKLEAARRLRDQYPVARFVTRGGEWTDTSGAVHGGSTTAGPAATRLGLQERRTRVETALGEAEARLTDAEVESDAARRALDAAAPDGFERARDEARHALDAARADVAHRQATREALVEGRQRLAERAHALDAAEAEEPDPATFARAADAAEAEAARAAAACAEADAGWAASDARRAEADTVWNDARLHAVQARGAADALAREAERAGRALADLALRAHARADEAARLRAALAEADEAAAALTARLDEERTSSDVLERNVAEAEGLHLDARAAAAETERAIRAIRQARDAARERQGRADVGLAEARTRRQALDERLRDEHGATLSDAEARLEMLADEGAAFEPEAARAEIPRIREAIRGLGAVNALALEEYEEEKSRLDGIRAQRADLEAAEGTLLETIAEINRTAAERFGETFEAVREAFQRLFRDLFGETATADLTLDGDDPLEAPVEILAQPRGKRPVTLAQLSGGEKTLTATALLFAIYLVKPSPFCILDEVDAPLDDANVERFMRLVRSFAGRTQFVLVTHNKLTMEAADRLYGITMPEPGVSRLVGVNFDEAGGDGLPDGGVGVAVS